MLKQIDLLRHGEPVGGRMYRGQTDHPLSDRGWREMREAVAERNDWDMIVHSPLCRCADFADELATRLNIVANVDDRLKEIGFGRWENRTGDDIRQQDAEAFRNFYHDPVNHQPEGAECLRSFYGRISEAWEEISARHDIERILLIAHSGVIRAIIANVLRAPLQAIYRMQIASAGMVAVKFSDERPPTIQL